MKKLFAILGLGSVLLFITFGGFTASGRSRIFLCQAAPQSAQFVALLDRLRGMKEVSTSSTGIGAQPGAFFKLSEEFQKHGTQANFIELLRDQNPVVRVMGLVCLARSDAPDRPELLRSLTADKQTVMFRSGCLAMPTTVGEIAERLIGNSHYFGRRKAMPTRD